MTQRQHFQTGAHLGHPGAACHLSKRAKTIHCSSARFSLIMLRAFKWFTFLEITRLAGDAGLKISRSCFRGALLEESEMEGQPRQEGMPAGGEAAKEGNLASRFTELKISVNIRFGIISKH